MSNFSNGKKPLAAKAKARPTPLNMDDIFGDPLGIDPAIKKALTDKGLVWRWINAPKLQEFGGYHNRGWRPIKLKEIGCDTLSSASDIVFGSDPEGYIRRGDCILGVRAVELNEKHKAYLNQQNAARTRLASNKAQADEMRRVAREAGVEMNVHEGYEDEEINE